MRIIVFNVAAEHGGALTILKEFYNEVSKNYTDINWVFIVSTPILEQRRHITILSYSWVKKSWFHRLFFEYLYIPRIIKEINPDLIFSMQNISVKSNSIKQVIYLHQPIPFSTISFSIFKTPVLWIYQNILSHKIFKSIEKADKVVVQTQWMRDAAINKTKVSSCKFEVIPPDFDGNAFKVYENTDKSKRTFFYPVSFTYYKNHKVIIDAVRILLHQGADDFEIIFTGNKEEALQSGLHVENIPVRFIGNITHEKVLDYMTNSVLLFPSLLETYGLPLVEAKTIGTFIIASDLPFSHEILDNYPNVTFFNPLDANALAKIMYSFLKSDVKYHQVEKRYSSEPCRTTWRDVVNVLKKA